MTKKALIVIICVFWLLGAGAGTSDQDWTSLINGQKSTFKKNRLDVAALVDQCSPTVPKVSGAIDVRSDVKTLGKGGEWQFTKQITEARTSCIEKQKREIDGLLSCVGPTISTPKGFNKIVSPLLSVSITLLDRSGSSLTSKEEQDEKNRALPWACESESDLGRAKCGIYPTLVKNDSGQIECSVTDTRSILDLAIKNVGLRSKELWDLFYPEKPRFQKDKTEVEALVSQCHPKIPSKPGVFSASLTYTRKIDGKSWSSPQNGVQESGLDATEQSCIDQQRKELDALLSCLKHDVTSEEFAKILEPVVTFSVILENTLSSSNLKKQDDSFYKAGSLCSLGGDHLYIDPSNCTIRAVLKTGSSGKVECSTVPAKNLFERLLAHASRSKRVWTLFDPGMSVNQSIEPKSKGAVGK